MTIGQSKLDAVEALEKSTLEYTLFYVGYFLDFWGYPRVQSHQRQNLIVVDIEYNKAAIPGEGNTPVTFTHTFDVAEFVAASLDLPSWEKESYVIGESITWNEFLRLAGEVKGTPPRDTTLGSANPLSQARNLKSPMTAWICSYLDKSPSCHRIHRCILRCPRTRSKPSLPHSVSGLRRACSS